MADNETVINVAVEEVSGVSLGTRVVANHNASDPNQHTIGAITGLSKRLKELEVVRTSFESSNTGHADYHQWDDTVADDKKMDGIFVTCCNTTREDRIKPCTGEATEDIFGVTVSGANTAFIGGQNPTPVDANGDDYYSVSKWGMTHGLVATNGFVWVRCATDVDIGDVVVAGSGGSAVKTDGVQYGNKVVAIKDDVGVKYAQIYLGLSPKQAVDLAGDVKALNNAIGATNTNITALQNRVTDLDSKFTAPVDISDGTIGGWNVVNTDSNKGFEKTIGNYKTVINSAASTDAEDSYVFGVVDDEVNEWKFGVKPNGEIDVVTANTTNANITTANIAKANISEIDTSNGQVGGWTVEENGLKIENTFEDVYTVSGEWMWDNKLVVLSDVSQDIKFKSNGKEFAQIICNAIDNTIQYVNEDESLNVYDGSSWANIASDAYVVSGTWVFNDFVDCTAIMQQYVDFTTSDNRYIKIEVGSTGLYFFYSETDFNRVYSDAWDQPLAKTITFTSEQEVSETFYTWLIANATRESQYRNIDFGTSEQYISDDFYNLLGIYAARSDGNGSTLTLEETYTAVLNSNIVNGDSKVFEVKNNDVTKFYVKANGDGYISNAGHANHADDADHATNATNDENGKNIAETYAIKDGLLNGTITVKKAENAAGADVAQRAFKDSSGEDFEVKYAQKADKRPTPIHLSTNTAFTDFGLDNIYNTKTILIGSMPTNRTIDDIMAIGFSFVYTDSDGNEYKLEAHGIKAKPASNGKAHISCNVLSTDTEYGSPHPLLVTGGIFTELTIEADGVHLRVLDTKFAIFSSTTNDITTIYATESLVLKNVFIYVV